MTHITYTTAKRLKEFLGESAPEPMMNPQSSYCIDCHKCKGGTCKNEKNRVHPIYMLHDILSKPFLEAMCKSGATMYLAWVAEGKKTHKKAFRKLDVRAPIDDAGWMGKELYNAYFFDGGLPAVERALMEMMDTDKEGK